MFHKAMLSGFFDEIQKIAAASEQPQMQSAGPSELVTTSTLDPLNSWDKNPDWKKNSPKRSKGEKAAPQSSVPAQEANALMFQTPEPPKQKNLKLNYDLGSASALSPDRSQSPIDGQSTTNVAAGNMMSPAYGPGGV